MIDPLYNPLEHLTPAMRRCYLHHQRHWLAWLVETGKIKIADGVSIYINQRGFITDTLPVERLRLPPPLILHGAGAQERLEQQMETKHVNFIAEPEPEPQGPSSVANLIMSTISNAPDMRYVVWNQVFETLRTAPPAAQTAPWLVDLLRPAIQQEEAIWAYMEDFEESMSIDSLRRLAPEQLVFRIRDLMGLEATSEDPVDTVSAAYPDLAEAYLERMIAIPQHIADYGDELNTDNMKRLTVAIFKGFWEKLMSELRKGKLAYAMGEHLGLLEGTRRPGEPVVIDLT